MLSGLLAGLLLLCTLLTGCGRQEEKPYTCLDDLRKPGLKIGVVDDTGDAELVAELLPEAELVYYSNQIGAYTAVQQGKLDAFVFGKLSMQMAIREGLQGVRLLDETIGSYVSAAALSPVSGIPDLERQLNAFLDELEESGTRQDMVERWIVREENEMPAIPLPEDAPLHLTVGTAGTYPPFNYYVGTELRGYEIELATRFAAWLGATLEFKVYDYGAIVTAAQTGDVDCVFADLFVTPEREEAIRFSHPTYVEPIAVMVRDPDSKGAAHMQSFADLENARIGVTTGSIQVQQVEQALPNAEIFYFTTDVDMLNALQADKIDAFAMAEAIVRYMMTENPELSYLPDALGDVVQIAAAFPKTDSGRRLCDEFSEYIRQIKENGVFEEIDGVWFGEDEEKRAVPDLYTLTGENGTLRMAADTQFPPFAYIKDGKPVGVDVDTVVRFCKARGYGLEIVNMDFGGIIPALVSGKVDFACGGIARTAERAESVYFSEPTYESHSVMAIIQQSESAQSGGFLSSLAESFEKTFLRENRWQLFLQGIGTTMLITALSILFGTALGFGVFLLCRKGNPVANAVTRFCVWLVQGMPVVVLLMVLYYIVFGKVNISGTAISVVGFTLVFASGVYSMVKAGVATVDRGQTEAAYALGYTDRRSFFRVVLPQALPHFMPAYKGEITALIKATAVVGYVAVQDLTKMGDIVRSRTYEAFFPLIAVAAIYFILAAVLTFFVNKIELYIDPRRRSRKDILKGLHTD